MEKVRGVPFDRSMAWYTMRKIGGTARPASGWGLLHSRLRQKFPKLSRLCGLPFAIPFFFACDGGITPLIGISPKLRRIPWQPSAKEMGNHITWTAVSELVHRLAARVR